MTNNPHEFVHDINAADRLMGIRAPTRRKASEERPLEEDIFRVFRALFLDQKITLDEFKAYFLFLETYFDDVWRTVRPDDYNDKTKIVEMMLEINKQLSDHIKADIETHNILYTKKTDTKMKAREHMFLPGDFNYMYRLFTGLIEAGVIVRAPRDYEHKRFPDLFTKKLLKYLKSEDRIDSAVMIREKKVIDKRKKEAKEMSFQPAPSMNDRFKLPFVAKDKTTVSFIWCQEMEPKRLLYIMKLFFIPKKH